MEKKTLLIAEGDSWFALPDALFFYPWDILNHLESFGYEIKSVAAAGRRLQYMVRHTDKINKKIKNNKPKAILFSGGGNDVLGSLPQILNEGGHGKPIINRRKAKAVVRHVEGQYEQWLGSITKACKKYHGTTIPILIHGYGYPVPNNQPTFYLRTWLYPHFRSKKTDEPPGEYRRSCWPHRSVQSNAFQTPQEIEVQPCQVHQRAGLSDQQPCMLEQPRGELHRCQSL